MPAEPLSQKEIEDRLRELPGWALEGDRITRRYRFPSHFAAAGLTIHVAQIQEELNHHSDLTLGYNTVSLSVNTHDMRRGGHRERPGTCRACGGDRRGARRGVTERGRRAAWWPRARRGAAPDGAVPPREPGRCAWA